MSVNLFLWLNRIYLQKRIENKMQMQSCSKNGCIFFVSTSQKYFERIRPSGWLLYFMFSCLLYIFHLTTVKKTPTNSQVWYSWFMSKKFRGKWKAGSKRRGRLALPTETPLGYFMSVLSQHHQGLTLLRGECLRYLSLQWEAESNTFQGSSKASSLWTAVALKRQHLSQCKAW